MDKQRTDEEYLDSLNRQLEAIPPYVRQVSEAMVLLGEAVNLALNLRDHAVIQEMKAVCGEIFQQAEAVLEHDDRQIQ